MSNRNDDEFIIKTVDELAKVGPVYMQKEKGKALGRLSTPRDFQEAASQGYFDAGVNLRGNAIIGIADTMNFFSKTKCFTLHNMIYGVYTASASKEFKRGNATKDVLMTVRPDINLQKGSMPTPEAFGYQDEKVSE